MLKVKEKTSFSEFHPGRKLFLLLFLLTILTLGLFLPLSFAVGVALILLLHELGHVIAGSLLGVPMSLPIFLGPLGAVTMPRKDRYSATVDAAISIGGPLFSDLTTLPLLVAGFFLPYSYAGLFLLIMVLFTGTLNLFNLIPTRPFDGGGIISAVSPQLGYLGLPIIAAIAYLTNTWGILLLLPLAALATSLMIKRHKTSEFSVSSSRDRLYLSLAYVGLIIFSVLLLLLAAYLLVNKHYLIHGFIFS